LWDLDLFDILDREGRWSLDLLGVALRFKGLKV
jgi:hypothetical protein